MEVGRRSLLSRSLGWESPGTSGLQDEKHSRTSLALLVPPGAALLRILRHPYLEGHTATKPWKLAGLFYAMRSYCRTI